MSNTETQDEMDLKFPNRMEYLKHMKWQISTSYLLRFLSYGFEATGLGIYIYGISRAKNLETAVTISSVGIFSYLVGRHLSSKTDSDITLERAKIEKLVQKDERLKKYIE